MSLATNRPAEASQAVVELYCRELKLPGLRATEPYAAAFTDAVHTAFLVAAAVMLAAAAVAALTLHTEPPGSRVPVEATGE